MKKLFRLISAVGIVSYSALIFSIAAEADSYDTQIITAKQNIQTIQDNLSTAQTTLSTYIESQTVATNILETATINLNQAINIYNNESITAINKKIALDTAKYNYDTQLIPQIVSTGSGLTVKVYNNTISMTPNESNLCRTTSVTEIAANWGGGSVLGCNSDRVTIHYYGTLTVPQTMSYQFKNIADDGFYMTLNNQVVINNWYDKGCGGNWGAPITLTEGTSYALDAWFYENGGGACSTLYYQTSANWAQVPSSWFGSETTTIMIKDPALLSLLNTAQSEYDISIQNKNDAKTNLDNTQISYDYAYNLKSNLDSAIATLNSTISQLNLNLTNARIFLENIPLPIINPPQNLTVTIDTSTIYLNWDAPASGYKVERYAVSWSTNNGGWGVASETTTITIPLSVVLTDGRGKAYTFSIRSDNDTLHIYSQQSNSVELFIANLISDTATATSDTSTISETSTTSQSTTETITSTTETSTASPPIDNAPQPINNPAPVPQEPALPVPPAPRPPIEVNPQPIPTQPITDPIVETPTDQPVDPEPEILEPNPEPDSTLNPDTPQVPTDLPVDQGTTSPDPSLDPDPSLIDDTTVPEQTLEIPQDIVDPQPEIPIDEPLPENLPSDNPNDNNPIIPTEGMTAEKWKPEVAPEQYLTKDEIKAYDAIGLIPNNPNQLPDSIPKLPDPVKYAELLKPHVQIDVPGVENGGITFFGTKTAPQVIGENGELTPPAPPPGSGLPIPPDAITTSDTFIGQPGGTSFNSSDIAVPVVFVPLEGAIASIPGAEAVNKAFVAMANIGNDMSPITRKKAKKILVITAVVGQIGSVMRRFK